MERTWFNPVSYDSPTILYFNMVCVIFGQNMKKETLQLCIARKYHELQSIYIHVNQMMYIYFNHVILYFNFPTPPCALAKKLPEYRALLVSLNWEIFPYSNTFLTFFY